VWLTLVLGPAGVHAADTFPTTPEVPADSVGEYESVISTPNEPSGELLLSDALALAIRHNPTLKAVSLEVRVQEAQALQAGLRPNPELQLELADFGGSGTRRSLHGAETTLQLGQLIERADKRRKRLEVADFAREVAQSEFDVQRQAVMLLATEAFVGVLHAQEQRVLAEQLCQTCSNLEEAVGQRVAAGKDPEIELIRAKILVAEADIRARRSASDLEESRLLLASTWGGTEARFERAVGRFREVYDVPDRQTLVHRLADNPRLLRWAHEKSRRRAQLDLERARAVSDIELGAGVRRFEDGDDTAFIVGLTIPLPLFDRNQAGIQEASVRHAQAIQQARAEEIRVRTELLRNVEELSRALSEIRVLETQVLPASQQALESIQLGYRDGKFDYLHALDTQRTTFDSRSRYIDVLRDYHSIRANIECMLGQSLDSLK